MNEVLGIVLPGKENDEGMRAGRLSGSLAAWYYTRNGLQEIPYYSRGSGFLGSFWEIILVNFGLLQLIQDLLDPKIRSWMA